MVPRVGERRLSPSKALPACDADLVITVGWLGKPRPEETENALPAVEGRAGIPLWLLPPDRESPGMQVLVAWAAAAGPRSEPASGSKACPGDLSVHPGEPRAGQPCPSCCLPRRGCSCFPRRRDRGSGPAQIPSAGPRKRNGADRYLSEAELREMIINVDGQAGE